jgi:hypothetical protein
MMSFSKWFSAVAAIVLLAGPSAAADAILAGKVKAINADKKTFVVTDAAGKDHSLKFDENVTINRGGKDSKNDVKAGDPVNVCHDNGVLTWTAHYILVQDGDTKNCVLVRCTVKSYDAGKKQITFTDTADKKDWTFGMGGAKVRLNGQDNKVENLKIGDDAVAIIDRTEGVEKGTLNSMLAWRK